jgi:sortase A
MKVFVQRQSLKSTLWWVQRALFAVAIVSLGYSGYILVDTWIFQSQETAALEQFVPERPATNSVILPAVLRPDGLIGRIEIPRLDLSVVVFEGTSNKTLRRAVGHITGTVLPGQLGNSGIAGHRDTFFRPLRNIQLNDVITLTTPSGAYRYRVVSTKVVRPASVEVLDTDGTEILTLVTCYPFYYVGPAPDRFIVRAERVT